MKTKLEGETVATFGDVKVTAFERAMTRVAGVPCLVREIRDVVTGRKEKKERRHLQTNTGIDIDYELEVASLQELDEVEDLVHDAHTAPAGSGSSLMSLFTAEVDDVIAEKIAEDPSFDANAPENVVTATGSAYEGEEICICIFHTNQL